MQGHGTGFEIEPAEVAICGTPELDIEQWQDLAALWLTRGHDSPELRAFAALIRPDAATIRSGMKAVLASLGCRPATADEFLPRCAAALQIVQRDLDRSDMAEYQMRPVNAVNYIWVQEVFAALSDGGFWSGGGIGGMTPDMDDDTLLYYAAQSVSDTVMEVLRVGWPLCPDHDLPLTAGDEIIDTHGDLHERVVWRCQYGAHDVAPVGQLGESAPHGR